MRRELQVFLVATCLTACAGLIPVPLLADDGPVKRYYLDMKEGGMHTRWNHPDKRVQDALRFLAVNETITAENSSHQFEVFVFAGDVFDFIGTPTRDVYRKKTYNVDAVVISTNTDAEWNVDRTGKEVKNPHIQTRLHKLLSKDNSSGGKDAMKKIDSLFASVETIEAATQAIGTQEILKFSPKQFCFIATDTVADGTYKDPYFLYKVLTEELLAQGVAESLELAASMKATSVVMPFIGSSRPDLRGTNLKPGDTMYLDKVNVKNEIIKRLNISLCGMLRGIYQFHKAHDQEKISIQEIGIVIYHEDVKLLGSGDWGFHETYGVPGLQQRLIGDFPMHLKVAKQGEKGKFCISEEDLRRPPVGVK